MRARLWLLAAWAGLIMAAYALRLHHLDFESFWVDEALVLRSPLEPGQFRVGQATYTAFNAPLYWLLLAPWRQGAGESEYAVRYFSLVFSTLAVPLSFALASRVFGREAAWSATTLVTANTFLIYYAQEGRTYALFTATTLASGYALVRACQRGSGDRWGLYLAAGVATAASHVFGLLAAAGQAAYLFVSQPRKARTGALALAAFALPAAAFLVALQSPLASPLATPVGELGRRAAEAGLQDLLLLLGQWTGYPPILPWQVGGTAAALLLAGAVAGLAVRKESQPPGRGLLFTGTLLLVPLGLRLPLASVPGLHEERYMIFALPLFLMVIAGGVAGWAGRRRAVAAAATFALAAWTLLPWAPTHLGDVRLKENWRDVITQIGPRLRADDIALTADAGALAYAVAFYAGKPLEYRSARELPLERSEDQIAAFFTPYRDSGRQLLAVWSYIGGIPEDIEEWLDRHTLKAEEVAVPPLRAARYRFDPHPGFTAPNLQRPRAVHFADNLSLIGLDVGESPPDQRSLPVTLYWQARGPIAHEYNASVLLSAEDGEVWARESLPPARFYPTPGWLPGQVLREERFLPLDPGAPPGQYRLRLVLHRRDTGEALPQEGSDVPGPEAFLGEVELHPSWTGVDPPRQALSLNFQPAVGPQLVGAALPTASLRPGERFTLVTYWRGTGDGQPAPPVQLQVQGSQDRTSSSLRPAPSPAPTDSSPPEAPGELRARRLTFRLPPSVPAGGYQVDASLLDSKGRPLSLRWGWLPWTTTEISLGAMLVAPLPPPAVLPGTATRSDAPWIEGIRLRAFEMRARPAAQEAGRSLLVTLFWEAEETPDTGYAVFVHLLDASGKLVAQHDGLPGGGTSPTTSWLPGHLVEDPHTIALPGDLAAGSFQVVVGLYDRGSGRRLSRPDGADSLALGALPLP